MCPIWSTQFRVSASEGNALLLMRNNFPSAHLGIGSTTRPIDASSLTQRLDAQPARARPAKRQSVCDLQSHASQGATNGGVKSKRGRVRDRGAVVRRRRRALKASSRSTVVDPSSSTARACARVGRERAEPWRVFAFPALQGGSKHGSTSLSEGNIGGTSEG